MDKYQSNIYNSNKITNSLKNISSKYLWNFKVELKFFKLLADIFSVEETLYASSAITTPIPGKLEFSSNCTLSHTCVVYNHGSRKKLAMAGQ